MQSSTSTHHNRKLARQHVYRNLLRLLDKGLVKREVGSSRRPKYRLTDTFLLGTADISHQIQKNGRSELTNTALDTHFIKDRLHQLKVEMLSTIGETEEYNFICTELPDMQNDVQGLYNQARDNCSRLLGRIKALETLLVLHNPPCS